MVTESHTYSDGANPRDSDTEDYPGICVVTHPLSAAGENATRSLLDILSAIATVTLVTADLPENSIIRERFDVIEITQKDAGTSVAVAAIRFLFNQVRMIRTIAGRDEEIVLFFGASAYLLPVVAAKLLGRIVVIEPRGDVPLTLRLHWERRLPRPIARTLAGGVRMLERIDFRLADAIITYTPGMATQLELDPYEHKLYSNGARYVDAERFSPMIPFEERDRRVGYVGRIDEEKGIRELAAAIRELSSDITFRFIGDGPLRPWLEDTLSEQLEAGTVEITGWVDHDDVPEELSRLRLLVLPSQPTEGLPTTILESLACGTPVYATPVSGVPDVVRDGDTGFLMENATPTAMAAEISHLLDRNDLATISANARSLIEREYTYDRAVERYRTILDSLE